MNFGLSIVLLGGHVKLETVKTCIEDPKLFIEDSKLFHDLMLMLFEIWYQVGCMDDFLCHHGMLELA